MRPIIGFSGLIGSGKTWAADVLIQRHGFKKVRFAGPLKAMCAALGMTYEEIDGHDRNKPSDLLCGRTPRYALQTLGTEWGRQIIGENLWVNAWLRAVEAIIPAHLPVVVDDVRFENEAAAVRSLGGKVIRIHRPGLAVGDHASEQGCSFDYCIDNDADRGAFAVKINALVA